MCIKLRENERLIEKDIDNCFVSGIQEFKRQYKEECGSAVVITSFTDRYVNLSFDAYIEADKIERIFIGDVCIYDCEKQYDTVDRGVYRYNLINHRKDFWVNNEENRREGRFRFDLQENNLFFEVFGLDLSMFRIEELPNTCTITYIKEK